MENLRGAAWMTLAMLVFAILDMFIKLLSDSLPTWQIIAILGAGSALAFGLQIKLKGQRLFPRATLSPAILLRNTGEMLATLSFATAIALTPLSSASAIIQATPLAVTLGAAVFLREKVGWKRWSAILAGFAGVLLIIRPGLEGFDGRSLFAVLAVVGLALRDLATRRVPPSITSAQISFLAMLSLIPAALILGAVTGTPPIRPVGIAWLEVGCAIACSVLAYYAITSAMRGGEISFVTPFRYSRILFALVVGMVVFDERPDVLMLIGAALVVGSGLFTLWRERKHGTVA